MYGLLLAVIYLAFISLGLPDSLLGSAWPAIHTELDLLPAYMGFISMTISCGTVVSSLLSERLTKRLGTKYVTIISVIMTAVALMGFSVSGSLAELIAWAVPYGLGAGAIDAALNNYVAQHYTSRHMSWLHCFWGVGTVVSPNIMSMALARGSWQSGYRTVSLLQFGIAAILALSLPLWRREGQNQAQESPSQTVGIKNTLRIKGVPALLAAFFCYCAAESTVMLWLSSFLVGERGMTEESAAAFASTFFIGMTVGRFLSGFVSDKFGDRKMIITGAVVAAAGIAAVALPVASPYPALVGFTVIGLGFAPIYPAFIHSTPFNFGFDNSQAIIGMQMASGYCGSIVMPPVFGVLSGVCGMKLLPFYMAAFIAFTVIMARRTFACAKRG